MANITKRDNTMQTRDIGQARGARSPFSLIDRFFDDALDPFSMVTPSLFNSQRLSGTGISFPKVDVTETENEIQVVANVPGVDPDKVDIEVGEDYLSISGQIDKENKETDKQGKVYRYEREYGQFRREFTLPARVNKEGIVAKAKNGVLTITLPKSEQERKTKVRVQAE